MADLSRIRWGAPVQRIAARPHHLLSSFLFISQSFVRCVLPPRLLLALLLPYRALSTIPSALPHYAPCSADKRHTADGSADRSVGPSAQLHTRPLRPHTIARAPIALRGSNEHRRQAFRLGSVPRRAQPPALLLPRESFTEPLSPQDAYAFFYRHKIVRRQRFKGLPYSARPQNLDVRR